MNFLTNENGVSGRSLERARSAAHHNWPALAATLVIGMAGTAIAQHPGGGHPSGGPPAGSQQPIGTPPHEHFDGRFSHNHYYYDHGYSVHRPPRGGPGEFHGRDGDRYWYHGGNWYRWRGGAWVVWGAPIGVFVPVLPPYFTTVWWNGIPYYYANDTYYVWVNDQNSYEVVDPPDGIDSSGSTQPPPSNQLFIYPKNGQSSQQQETDRYECHRWAVKQSGFDPTLAGGGVPAESAWEKRNAYFKADAACLEGRGYVVK